MWSFPGGYIYKTYKTPHVFPQKKKITLQLNPDVYRISHSVFTLSHLFQLGGMLVCTWRCMAPVDAVDIGGIVKRRGGPWVACYWSCGEAIVTKKRPPKDLCHFTKLVASTLPKTNIAMENPPFWWYLQGNMGIFMGYVSFREGHLRWFSSQEGNILFFERCQSFATRWPAWSNQTIDRHPSQLMK